MTDPRSWIGRQRRIREVLEPARAQAMQAVLDRAPGLQAGEPLPPLWHWLYFWQPAPSSGLGPDGHAARGGFLPPIALPHRMWAGGRLRFQRPLPIGAEAELTSTISDVAEKQGRSGPLAFVTVTHEVTADGRACIVEEQDIVYRGGTGPASRPGEPAPERADWQRKLQADAVMLFRYSALTFNGHRIHYDRPYATQEEGYPGLVVHGPLLATLLLDLLTSTAGLPPPATFGYRAQRPVFDTAPFTLCGARTARGADLWVRDAEGCVAMRAQAAWTAANDG